MKPKVRKILSELRAGLDPLYGKRLANLVLFGSQARGDAVPGSDIDVLVVLKNHKVEPGKEIARTGKTVTALSLKYNSVISCTFVSADRYFREQTPLLLNARAEGVTI